MVYLGPWRRLVARVLWEHEVVGSNPAAPTFNEIPEERGRSVRIRGASTQLANTLGAVALSTERGLQAGGRRSEQISPAHSGASTAVRA